MFMAVSFPHERGILVPRQLSRLREILLRADKLRFVARRGISGHIPRPNLEITFCLLRPRALTHSAPVGAMGGMGGQPGAKLWQSWGRYINRLQTSWGMWQKTWGRPGAVEIIGYFGNLGQTAKLRHNIKNVP